MDYQIIELEEFNVIGIRYELSKSLSNNVKLAQNHWKIFNSKLRNNKLYLGSNWCKYAFIEKIENKIFYYISIPKKDFVPNDFTEKIILKLALFVTIQFQVLLRLLGIVLLLQT